MYSYCNEHKTLRSGLPFENCIKYNFFKYLFFKDTKHVLEAKCFNLL